MRQLRRLRGLWLIRSRTRSNSAFDTSRKLQPRRKKNRSSLFAQIFSGLPGEKQRNLVLFLPHLAISPDGINFWQESKTPTGIDAIPIGAFFASWGEKACGAGCRGGCGGVCHLPLCPRPKTWRRYSKPQCSPVGSSPLNVLRLKPFNFVSIKFALGNLPQCLLFAAPIQKHGCNGRDQAENAYNNKTGLHAIKIIEVAADYRRCV